MDIQTSAVLIMLACAPNGDQCHEMRMAETYPTIEGCRAALSAALRNSSQPGRPVIGRCASEADLAPDPMVTGSVNDAVATVRVTRITDGNSTTSTYRVPKGTRYHTMSGAVALSTLPGASLLRARGLQGVGRLGLFTHQAGNTLPSDATGF
jgi:hypothetical protein